MRSGDAANKPEPAADRKMSGAGTISTQLNSFKSCYAIVIIQFLHTVEGVQLAGAAGYTNSISTEGQLHPHQYVSCT